MSVTPKELGDQYVALKARERAGEPLDETERERERIYICEMLVRVDEDDERSARYTCRHFLPDVGLCGAYEQRPALCRDYPDYGRGDVCEHCHFGLSAV